MTDFKISLGNNLFAAVSEEDVVYLSLLCSWYRESDGSVRGRVNKKLVRMHQVVAERMGLSGEIDHEDRDPLNNTRNNLRTATRTQNLANREGWGQLPKGVTLSRDKKKYCAQIAVEGRYIWLGTFDTADEAAHEYNKAAKIHFGSYALENK